MQRRRLIRIYGVKLLQPPLPLVAIPVYSKVMDGSLSIEDQECLASCKGHLSEGHQSVATINEEIKPQRYQDG